MQNGFIEELKWRKMLHDSTPGLEEKLEAQQCTGYIGFDPTAKSLTIGNYVQVMILSLFQKCGHRPIVLMGGATGRIGDPSGKDAERDLLSYEVLEANLDRQVEQFERLLNFEDDAAIMLNNYDFYKDMNALDFLREIGKNLTVNYMLSKESVKKRLETGISFTEFSYQLLQAYDFLHMYRNNGCIMQMGGSDQWGNITSGIEFVRRNEPDGKAYGITTPLLTKADGSKFGKSEAGNIWLDPDLTSPYQFYQFWIRADDRDISKFLRYFSFKSREEILALEGRIDSEPNEVKRALAEELTIRIHSKSDYDSALQVSQLIFNPKLKHDDLADFGISALKMIAREISSYEVPRDIISSGTDIVSLLCEHTQICASRGEARRAIQANAVAVNKVKVQSLDEDVTIDHALHDTYVMIENGKKNKFVIQLV